MTHVMTSLHIFKNKSNLGQGLASEGTHNDGGAEPSLDKGTLLWIQHIHAWIFQHTMILVPWLFLLTGWVHSLSTSAPSGELSTKINLAELVHILEISSVIPWVMYPDVSSFTLPLFYSNIISAEEYDLHRILTVLWSCLGWKGP